MRASIASSDKNGRHSDIRNIHFLFHHRCGVQQQQHVKFLAVKFLAEHCTGVGRSPCYENRTLCYCYNAPLAIR